MNTRHVYTPCMNLTLSKHSNAIEIRNRMKLDFYPGLPHALFSHLDMTDEIDEYLFLKNSCYMSEQL